MSPRPGDPDAYEHILRPGGRHSDGTVARAEGRRMSLDRMVADSEGAPIGARIRAPNDLREATGTPVAMITVDVVGGEPRAYLVVPSAPGVESTVTRIRDDQVVALALAPGLEVELGLARPTSELQAHDAELADGTIVKDEKRER